MQRKMPKPRKHIFVCVNQRPAGDPKGCCADKGGVSLRDRLKEACAKVDKTVRVSRAMCLGPCAKGINVVVYPEAVWYCGVKESDIKEIVEEHIVHDRPVQRLLNSDMT